jgi:hypothetical protein
MSRRQMLLEDGHELEQAAASYGAEGKEIMQ